MNCMQEVGDLVTDLYETLAEMRCIEPADIKRGPHNITLPGDTGDSSYNRIDPAIANLYSILPYVEYKFSGHRNFFRGSFFLGFRRERHRRQSRGPFRVIPNTDRDFNTTNGPYTPSWVTPLSVIGTRPVSILYNARQHRIWILNVEEHRSADLALEGVEPSPARGIDNRWAFDHLPSRPAPDRPQGHEAVVSRIQSRPDSLRSSGGEAKLEERMRLFQKHGWPDAFDSKAFQMEPVRKNSARLAAWHAEAPLRVMKRLEDDSERASRWAEVGRLGSSAPVDETALKVVQLKRAQCADAFEASRAAAKNLQLKGPVRAQLEYARRRRDNDYHSGLLQFRKKEFSFVARKWSILPDVQALED
ncbi:unnamed protein product [Clonostachys rosea f. rosea IK726]|uniref:Uncharacterized protein n=1 Tax=Clonostachys rosea f. rosea IK726 TaxID=1349383 RepID=A0ACA9UC34_BIOOC|nr:unnamed protein product [Clonostachys rosea f. rosea IK726]